MNIRNHLTPNYPVPRKLIARSNEIQRLPIQRAICSTTLGIHGRKVRSQSRFHSQCRTFSEWFPTRSKAFKYCHKVHTFSAFRTVTKYSLIQSLLSLSTVQRLASNRDPMQKYCHKVLSSQASNSHGRFPATRFKEEAIHTWVHSSSKRRKLTKIFLQPTPNPCLCTYSALMPTRVRIPTMKLVHSWSRAEPKR